MIEVKNLSKRFRHVETKTATRRDVREADGWFRAVRGVSFHCAPGEVLGLLGPNGAGKTTTLRLLATALKPDSGAISINGVDAVAQPMEARRQIGFLSGSTGLYGRLTVRENVEFSGKLHGMRGQDLKRRCDELFELLDMHDFAHKKAGQVSAGMKQKCAIARTVLHDPKVIVLDEPTTGLDVMAAKTLIDFIGNYKRRRVPLIFSTHHLHEVEKLCDRVCIINRGETVFNDTTAALRQAGGEGGLFDGFIQVVNGGA
ncbi:ATP-binding cassette domain-containing protein [Massilia sp. ST3]|uniref:ABC transporter ATP-binding protein n=1 Tax=Massilia sp. ST3 TaxID=2824903 RepID=UPI001B8230D6|nr:ATP-binding cassette domain-containing protein [Massilia sp. ST3]MBQ5949415.1 ATP-binding cassette domain-containing protein [Massilia sp. ST3]